MEMYYIHYCGQQVLYNINPVPNYDEITPEAKTKFGLMVGCKLVYKTTLALTLAVGSEIRPRGGYRKAF